MMTAAVMRASVNNAFSLAFVCPLTACVVTAPNECPDIQTFRRSGSSGLPHVGGSCGGVFAVGGKRWRWGAESGACRLRLK
jgi:hypothetical protein